MKNEITVFFDDLPIRKILIDGEWWISTIDTARAIGYTNPAREVTRIIDRNKERFNGYTTVAKLGTVEGCVKKVRRVKMFNLKGVIAFCMLSKLSNAIPFQRWADNVLAERIKDKKTRRQIYGELTDDSVCARKLETSQWQRHGAKGKDFGKLTKMEYSLLFDNENKLKKEMSGEELIKLMISNYSNAYQLMKKENQVGLNGIENQLYKTNKLINGLDDKKEIEK